MLRVQSSTCTAAAGSAKTGLWLQAGAAHTAILSWRWARWASRGHASPVGRLPWQQAQGLSWARLLCFQGEKVPPSSPAHSRDWGTVLQSLLWLLGRGTGAAGHAGPCHHLSDPRGMLGEGADEPALADRSQLPATNGNKDSKGLGWSLVVDLPLNILRERICWKKTLFLLSLSMSYLVLYWIFQPASC